MSIYITGDTHSGNDMKKLERKRFPQGNKLTKNDYLIILGDFGLWKDKKSQDFIKWVSNKKWTTLFIEGNHEDYNYLKTFPIVNMFEGKVRKINDSLYQLMRGEVYTIDGKKIFTFGGASSIEKYYINLEEGIEWFKEEECTKDEAIYALNNLKKSGNKIDVILTHTCSLSSLKKICNDFNMILEKEDNQNIFFDYLKNKIDYSIWLFGHMHLDFNISNKEKAVFNKVLDLNDLLTDKQYHNIYDIEKISRLGVSEFYIEKFK